jgi:hypothetical protein
MLTHSHMLVKMLRREKKKTRYPELFDGLHKVIDRRIYDLCPSGTCEI